ncbi:SDR family NAD(P)-dependent oxidoreductase [Streptomyces sp. PSRA5]|uniref:SDR family NAD(P)-dependent oxidoreductase n=1 Tax=Streptomyces panacea TaxID=3035064 RepID=UPI00339C5B40
MKLHGATALVTGTNRGFGHHLAVELLRRGAKVYATARRPELIDIPGAEVLRLDITDQGSVDAAAQVATDVDFLVNNAGFTGVGNLMTGDLDTIRQMMDSNYYGTLAMIRAFAPVLAGNGGGAILNVLSSTAWTTVDGNTSLAAAKSAQWGLTNGVRVELVGQRTLVSALVAGPIATETLRDFVRGAGLTLSEDVNDPADLARLALDGIEAGEVEILDRFGIDAKATLAGPPQAFDLAAIANS